ncbi:MAG: DUF1702 family protein [Pseudomonadota bacterium]|nr:DUF1702 family protein [Pseudomonadota bacterium]
MRHRLLAIPAAATACESRGFQTTAPGIQAHLERIGNTFVHGYHAALRDTDPQRLGQALDGVAAPLRGFAFEGAAMGLMLLDLLSPWKSARLDAFLRGPGADHIYMVHVGAGWAMARLPWGRRRLNRLDPLLRWLAVDGYGFHQGYFHWREYIDGQRPPALPPGYARRAFDQGLGRSLWFVRGADPERIAHTVGAFPPPRRADLWSGVGLAAAYAGGVGGAGLETLYGLALPHRSALAQGAAFAAKARQRAGNPASHTDLACRVLCGLSADRAAAIADAALGNLPATTIEPAYERWRRNIRAHFPESDS